MANEIVLVEYDKACRQIAEALSADEIGKIRDSAMMLRACAKVVNNKKLEADAWEIRIRAERRLGQMLAEGKGDRASVGNPQWVSPEPIVPKPTLNGMEIGKSLANKARRLADLPQREFGIMLIDGRKNVENTMERAPQLKAKPKKKAKAERDLECPYCGKAVHLKAGKLEK